MTSATPNEVTKMKPAEQLPNGRQPEACCSAISALTSRTLRSAYSANWPRTGHRRRLGAQFAALIRTGHRQLVETDAVSRRSRRAAWTFSTAP